MRKLFVATFVVGGMLLGVQPAAAQTIVKAYFKFSLTDAASGAVVYTDRVSSRSWTSLQKCEAESKKAAGFGFLKLDSAEDAVEAYGLVNKDGVPLDVKLTEMSCVVVRE